MTCTCCRWLVPAGRLVLECSESSLAALVAERLAWFQPQLDEAGVRTLVNITDGVRLRLVHRPRDLPGPWRGHYCKQPGGGWDADQGAVSGGGVWSLSLNNVDPFLGGG